MVSILWIDPIISLLRLKLRPNLLRLCLVHQFPGQSVEQRGERHGIIGSLDQDRPGLDHLFEQTGATGHGVIKNQIDLLFANLWNHQQQEVVRFHIKHKGAGEAESLTHTVGGLFVGQVLEPQALRHDVRVKPKRHFGTRATALQLVFHEVVQLLL